MNPAERPSRRSAGRGVTMACPAWGGDMARVLAEHPGRVTRGSMLAADGTARPAVLRLHAMDSKKLIWVGAFLGSVLGGCVPGLWHASTFSMTGLVFSTLGALAGIWLAWRFTR